MVLTFLPKVRLQLKKEDFSYRKLVNDSVEVRELHFPLSFRSGSHHDASGRSGSTFPP